MPKEAWEEYHGTFTGSDYTEIWDSLFLFHRIFCRAAELTAGHFGFVYPKETAAKVKTFLEHVRNLPENSDSIY